MLDLDLDGWLALDDQAARRCAEGIAAAVDGRLVDLRWHEYRGRAMRLALVERDGRTFSLVPGGPARLGHDADRFQPSPELAADFAAYRAEGPTDGPDMVDLIRGRTTPARTATISTLLVAVTAEEAGVTECRPDHPRVAALVAAIPDVPSLRGARRFNWPLQARAWLSPDGSVARAWLIDVPTYDDIVTDLAGRGERLAAPDEWEYACGAGATTLWRWGDECPLDVIPVAEDEGPHREPNLFGLTIGDDPYHAERTAVRDVVCGGDGGVALHHGDWAQFGAWLPLATAYRNADHGRRVAEGEGRVAAWIRPVIEVT